MATARINVPLEKQEVIALVRIAQAECRQPRDQLRFLLREEAFRRGLLSKEYQEKREEEHDGKTAVARA